VKVTILPNHETRLVRARTVAALLTELQLHQDAFLVVRGDEILTRDVRLREDDEVELLPVISGGGTP
jgi:sulfur carrier protein